MVGKDRLVAFTDGVVAVIVTIMVLDLKAPADPTLAGLREVLPTFTAYVLSFLYVAIYWVNHHHFFHLVERTTGGLLWANLHLLFWLSLIPFATAWIGAHPASPVPVCAYGLVLLMPALAWYVLQASIMRTQGGEAALRRAIGRDVKGKISPVLYVAGAGLAFVHVWLADAVYVAVALLWLVPDRRIERSVRQ